jgi:glycosyltransferase involved in cell wall biosynthesis
MNDAGKMKIGILGTRGIPNRYGGFEECAEKLALGLAAKGHDVWVYNSEHHELKADEWQGVHIVHCKDPEDKLGTAGQFLYDLNCINDARRRSFAVVLQLGYTSSSVWWWRWPRNAVNIVNMDGLEWKRSKYSRKVQAFLRRAEAWAARHADALVADSLAIQDYLKRKYGKDSSFIPYGATVHLHPDHEVLSGFGVAPEGYHLLIARMEPENNIETIIRGCLDSGDSRPVLVVGNTGNAFGTRMKQLFAAEANVCFLGAIYDAPLINALRHDAFLYYHGHSVGGTNPSLLEAMGCRARIAAHRNPFNEAILGSDAFYFSDASDIAGIIRHAGPKAEQQAWLDANVEKIRTTYNWPAVVDAYELMMRETCGKKR